MKRIIIIVNMFLLLLIGLAACSKGENNATVQPKNDKNSYEPILPEKFTEEFLTGNYEQIYTQLSEDFQNQVPLDELKQLGEKFNQNVNNYELISELEYQGMTEYLWLSDEADKGIRSLFAEDLTIEALLLLPVRSYPDTDAKYTKNEYRMPINEEWFTFWGGTNELVNYHYPYENQRYAYDLLIFEGDSSYDGEQTENESFFAFGKEVVAPLNGTVVSVEKGIPDNIPGIETNADEPLGNHVIIEHENNEYSIIAHFKQNSVVVDVGDEVEAGEFLGLAGNSGNSSEAHIHFHVANSSEWEEATSLRIKFENGIEPIRGELTTGF